MNVKTIDITGVTEEQIDRCHRFLDLNNNSLPFYLVESESDSLKEYKVEAIRKDGHYYITCTCPAGLHGFANCKAGYCKHVKWAVAASEDFKQLIKAQAAAEARIAAEKVPAPATTQAYRIAAEQIVREALCKNLNVSYASANVDNATLARILERDQERKARNKKPSRKVAYCQTRPVGFSLLK